MRIPNMHCETCKIICPEEPGAERDWLILMGYRKTPRCIPRHIAYCPDHIPDEYKKPKNFQWPRRKALAMMEKMQYLYWGQSLGLFKRVKERHLTTISEILVQHPDLAEDYGRLYLKVGDALVEANKATKTQGNLLYDHTHDSCGTRPPKALPVYLLVEEGRKTNTDSKS